MTRTAVIVLGMHRSGTSALAGALSRLGIPLGREMMPAGGENERGFFENTRAFVLNEAILTTLGSAWDSPFPLRDGWWEDGGLEPRKKELAEILRDEFGGAPVFAVKDPRLCRLFPFWRGVLEGLGIAPCFILALRDPGEVTSSLGERNGISAAKAELLWLDHMLEAERISRDGPRAVVPFDRLLHSPVPTLRAVSQSLGIRFPRDPEKAAGEIGAFLNPGLKHHRAEERPGSGHADGRAAAAHAALLALARCDGPDERAALDRIRARFRADRDLFHPPEVVAAGRGGGRATDEIRERNRRIADLETRLYEESRRLSGVVRSKSWRWTASVRAAAESFRTAARLSRRWVRAGLKTAYHGLPLSDDRKRRIKKRLFAWLGLRSGEPAGDGTPGPDLRASAPALADRDRPETRPALPNPRDLEFEAPREPAVSVIIPVYNRLDHTLECLRSLEQHVRGEASHEVIVVDDGSTDGTAEALSRIRGLKVLRNASNLGFLESCNRAAGAAAGRYLVFLNNDARATPGWLRWLLATFEAFPDAGIAGSKLLFPEGLLQEAGGIVWRDGSASHYGRLDDPGKPRYGAAREVDYVSGASLMIPRELFHGLGGFDPFFAPGYYEDADLAFRVRGTGRTVIYQPNSIAIHHEGATAGTDLHSGTKRFQAVNMAKFRERWAATLEGHAEPGAPMDAAADRLAGPRVLVIDECLCRPDRDAGSLRMWRLLGLLRERNARITFIPDNGAFPEPYLGLMQGHGIEVVRPAGTRSVRAFLKARGASFDLAILSRSPVAASHAGEVRKRCPGARLVFDTVDLHFLRERREAEATGDAVPARRSERSRVRELDLASRADLTLVVSRAEADILRRERPGVRTAVVSMIHDVADAAAPYAAREGLLFVGGFGFSPNADAVGWFAARIFPLVRERLPGVRLFVAGGDPPPEVRALAADDVRILGHVPGLEALLQGCRVSVAPLRWGAGVKGKITQSLSHGLPVVATPVAADGMPLVDRENALIAADPAGFAAAILELYGNERLWTRLSENGRETVRRHYSVEAARTALFSELGDVLPAPPPPRGADRPAPRESGPAREDIRP